MMTVKRMTPKTAAKEAAVDVIIVSRRRQPELLPVGNIVRMPSLICSGAGSDVLSSTSRIVRMILGAKKMSKDGKITTNGYKKDWILTENAWSKLLQYLDADPDQAGRKYERIRHRLIKFFEWRNFHSPEDLADETINRVARRIEEGVEIRAPDPLAYFHRVADLVAKEEFRGQKRWSRAASPSSRKNAIPKVKKPSV